MSTTNEPEGVLIVPAGLKIICLVIILLRDWELTTLGPFTTPPFRRLFTIRKMWRAELPLTQLIFLLPTTSWLLFLY